MADAPKSPGELARARVVEQHTPAAMRDEVRAGVEKTEKVRDAYARKRRVAAFAGLGRAVERSAEAVEALAVDDALMAKAKIVSARQLEREQQAHDDAQLRKPKTSRRRHKADAFKERGAASVRRPDEWLLKYRDVLRAAGQADADPVGVPVFVHNISQLIMSDPTGHVARIKLASVPREIARKIRKGALNPEPYEGTRQREGRELKKAKKPFLKGNSRYWVRPGERRWIHPAAIRTVALGVAAWHLGRGTSRRGFSRVVRGLPALLWCKLAADGLTGVAPCLSTLFGNNDETPGAMRALVQSGLFLPQQPPGNKVAACDRGPSGFAFNGYWFYAPRDNCGQDGPPTEADVEIAHLREARLQHDVALGRAPPAVA